MAISRERMKIAQNKFNSGLGSKIDLLQAQVDLNAQRSAYLQQQTAIAKSKSILNQLIALPADNDYQVEDSIPVNTGLILEDFRDSVFHNNPDLQLAAKNIDIARYSLQEIQRSRFPVISFNSAYAYGRQVNQQQTSRFSPSSNQSNGLQYGFSASIPILNGFNISRQTKDAKLNIAYEQLNYQNQKSQVDVAVQNAFKDYNYYIQAMQLEEENLSVAQENMTVALEAFRQGQTTTIEVQTAQQGLADATYRLISARYNAKVAETVLLQLRGNILK
jgi:outer membrane protein TolC